MLAQNHTTGAEDAGKDQYHAKPPHGIEAEELAEHEEGTGHTADSSHMGGDLPPYIDQRTDNLNKQGRRDHRSHEMGDMQQVHQIDAEEITEDGDHIWNDTALLDAELYQVPPLIATVEMDEHCGQQDGEHIDERQHLKLIGPRHLTEVTEHEQCHQPHQWQVEGGEQHAHDARCQNNILLFL